MQSLEHEMGGVQVYATALECVVNQELKQEWAKYHEETQQHVSRLEELWIKSLGIAAVLPPPEERRHVKTAIGAARAEQSAEKMR